VQFVDQYFKVEFGKYNYLESDYPETNCNHPFPIKTIPWSDLYESSYSDQCHSLKYDIYFSDEDLEREIIDKNGLLELFRKESERLEQMRTKEKEKINLQKYEKKFDPSEVHIVDAILKDGVLFIKR